MLWSLSPSPYHGTVLGLVTESKVSFSLVLDICHLVILFTCFSAIRGRTVKEFKIRVEVL